MKKIKVNYSVSTGYVGSTKEAEFELEVPIDATENEIEELVQYDFEEWLWNSISTYYTYESI